MKTLQNSVLIMLLMAIWIEALAQESSVKIDANSDIGSEGVFIGNLAGNSVVNMTDNTFIGNEAGRSNTNHRNTYIGSNAGSEGVNGMYNAFLGYNAGRNSASSNNVFIGAESGLNNTTGGLNVLVGTATGKSLADKEGSTFVGAFAGEFATEGFNTFLGYLSGRNSLGEKNLFVGGQTGWQLAQGDNNAFLGTQIGFEMTSGSKNTIVGVDAAQYKITGEENVYMGFESGWKNYNGNGNVFIGTQSGKYVTGDNQLYIENSDAMTTPLIYGDFANDKVGINTNDVPEGYTLAVRGQIISEEIRLMLYEDWPDYVFQPEYDMLTLEETEQQIEILGHLPGVPSAEEVGTEGIQIGEMNAILLEKIEELTLHMIDMNKEVKALQEENKTLKLMIND